LQQRQKDKEGYPNLWDVSAAGSALAGENSAAAASRELREELGLVHDFTKERPFLTTHFERGFDDWYFIRMEADISDLRLQPEEVQDARWADLAEIERMLDSGEMVPYYRDLVRLWFVMKDHRGSTTHE
ncbi:MAG TPA: NUDIX domain-containing protein, partial [Candidatus Negativibacillus faecipullorum]|nr:NUDIX domain-containing protein [Candidatus Negativibacillus faecipullorum]